MVKFLHTLSLCLQERATCPSPAVATCEPGNISTIEEAQELRRFGTEPIDPVLSLCSSIGYVGRRWRTAAEPLLLDAEAPATTQKKLMRSLFATCRLYPFCT